MDCFVNRAQAAAAQHPHYFVFPDYLPGLKRHRLMILPPFFADQASFYGQHFRRKLG